MYKVLVHGLGEKTYVGNGLEFETVDAAMLYGNELLGRWFGADDFQVLPVEFDGPFDTETVVSQSLGGY